jgi:hypothetical protein
MNPDRRTILSLVALGRISPLEAERLLANWPDADELVLIAAVCSAVAWMILPNLVEFLRAATLALSALLAGIAVAAHHTLICVAPWWGGMS